LDIIIKGNNMALKNFLKEGSYTRIERIDYSKHRRTLAFNIIVYSDDTLSEVLLETSMSLHGSYDVSTVNKILSTEEELYNEAPEYLNMKDSEIYLLSIESPLTEYANQLNNKIVFKLNDKITFGSPQFIYLSDTKETLERSYDGTYKKVPDDKIKTFTQFDNTFKPDTLISDTYNYLKSLYIYSDCENI
jgi:hypothetical protein